MDHNKTYTIACHSLGCKVNRYETDAILALFLATGFREVPFGCAADVYLINTCTVTGEADRKTRQMLRRARKNNAQAIVAAMGCHVETVGVEGLADVCVGCGERKELVARVQAALASRASGTLPAGLDVCRPLPVTFEEMGPVTAQSESRAYIKIQDGCNAFCSYCAIPYARGRARSRDPIAVLQEAKELIATGFEEIILTGVHLGAYGVDKGQDILALATLIQQLASLDGLRRLRLGSLEPESLTPAFIEMVSGIAALCPHFHLSLQSGSATVLARMHRAYDPPRFAAVVAQLRSAFPGAGITTDVMVGFPGESVAEHAESMAFYRQMEFSRMHVFRYSRRQGTRAAGLPGQIPAPIAARRASECAYLAEQMAEAFARRLDGSQREVLIETIDAHGNGEGYTPEYVPVQVDNLNDKWKGRILPCRLHATGKPALVGIPMPVREASRSH